MKSVSKMRRASIFVVLLLNCFGVFGQKEKIIWFKHKGSDIYYSASQGDLGFGVSMQVDSGAKRVDYYNPIPNQRYSNLVYLEGVKEINLYCTVKKDSAAFYRYSIQIDDQLIVKDATPLILSKRQYGQNLQQFKLGVFSIENKKITVSYYKVGDFTKVGTVIIYNKPLQKAMFNFVAFSKTENKQNYVEGPIRDSVTFNVDKATKAMLFAIKNIDLEFIYNVYLIDKSTSKIVYQTTNWEFSFFTPSLPFMRIDSKYFNKPGDYEIQVIPKLTGFSGTLFRSKTLNYNFTIKETDPKLFTSKEIAIIGLCLSAIFGVLLGGSILYVKRKNQKKLAFVQQQKEWSKIQLSGIRAQLNPHFMFNALAGIQNLMHTNKIDEANRYLGKFSRLTRNVLDGKELISLAEEKILLEDYLQMEQFRFGFNYELVIDESLNLDNIEIPAMLLQPFVENAVKHGISEMGTKGEIVISFVATHQNLVLKVKDNGSGFDSSQNYGGLGLQLSKNRISLLNTIYPDTPFLLAMQSSENGSEITLTLTQWL